MRLRYVVAAVALGLAAVGCSSSGSTAPGPPAAERTTSTPSATAAPTATSTPSPAPTGVPKLTERFTLLPCPHHPTSTLDYEGCTEHRVVGLDRRIDALTQALFNGFVAGDDESRLDLIAAQSAWVTYRGAACQSESDVYRGGTLAGLVAVNCFVRIDQERVKALHAMHRELTPG